MIRRITLLFVICIAAWMPSQAQKSAEALLDNVIEQMHKARGITAEFTLQGDERNALYMQGELKMKGKKFFLQTNGMATWYDGKTMWSYAEVTGEVNVTEPTTQELMSINPYYSIDKYKKSFVVTELQAARGGERRICLTPTGRNTSIARIVVTITTGSLQPVSFEITDLNNSTSRISVTNYRTDADLTENTFVYDASLYPQAVVVDLR